ncbi:hypothetical protein MMC18_009599 [Xylographa bjoerkii]|nr:hypothetical protein [Xylographa bjoerkii]
MVDPFTILGVVMNIIDLINSIRKVTTLFIQLRNDITTVPVSLRNLQVSLVAAEFVFCKTKVRAEAHDIEACVVLLPIVEAGEDQLKKLEAFIRGLLPTTRASCLENARTAISIVSNQEKIDGFRVRLMENVRTITDVVVATSLLDGEVSKIYATNERLAIDESIKELIQQLKLSHHHRTPFQSNNHSFHNSSNQATYYYGPVNYQIINGWPPSQTVTESGAMYDNIARVTSASSGESIQSSFAEAVTPATSTKQGDVAVVELETSSATADDRTWSQERSIRIPNHRHRTDSSTTLVNNRPSIETQAIESPSKAIEAANAILHRASDDINKNNSAAKEGYVKAVNCYSAIVTDDPVLQVRIYRNLSEAALGLSLVTESKETHISKARFYNKQAYDIACRSPHVGDRCRVMLDEARISKRDAKILDNRNGLPADIADVLDHAYITFSAVTTDLRDHCESAEDWTTLAQAFHGRGSAARKLTRYGRNRGSWTSYLEQGLNCVGQGSAMPQLSSAALERLTETGENIERELGRV